MDVFWTYEGLDETILERCDCKVAYSVPALTAFDCAFNLAPVHFAKTFEKVIDFLSPFVFKHYDASLQVRAFC
jgi:hypothetical protein